MCFTNGIGLSDGMFLKTFEQSSKEIIEKTKGTSAHKLIKLISKQHWLESFDFKPDGYIDDYGVKHFYRVGFKDKESVRNEIRRSEGCGGVKFEYAPTHYMYFDKLPL